MISNIKQIIKRPYSRSDVGIMSVSLILLIMLPALVLITNQQVNLRTEASETETFEVENGTITGEVTKVDDPNASGGKYARLGNVVVPTITPTPSGPQLYVSTTGLDTNPGTQTAPFRTVQKGINTAVAGTTINVGPGIYNEKIVITRSGTANGWIKLLSQTKHGAHITSPANQTGYTVSVQADYIHIEGFELTGGRITVDATSNNFVVKGNKVHAAHKMKATTNGGAGIEVYTDDYGPLTNVTIDGNMVYDIGQGLGDNQLVQGIYISVPCNGCKVTNNLIYKVDDFGIHAYHNPQNWIVANNTVFNNGRGILTGPGFKVVNNISMNNKSDNYDIRGTGNVLEKNISFGTGSAARAGVIVADPQFVNYLPDGTGDYHLKTTSPGYNGGTANYAPAFDITGAVRPLGGAYDIGIYEQ